LNPDTVAHLSTYRARRRLTSLIEANALTTAPDRQTVVPDTHFEMYHFRFFTVYSKPAASNERINCINQLVKYLSECHLSDESNLIVDGMNCDDINWVNMRARSDLIQDVLLNFSIWCGYS